MSQRPELREMRGLLVEETRGIIRERVLRCLKRSIF
jgi:hypothetical protein